MAETCLRMLAFVTVGLLVVLLVRHPARRVFGAEPAFTLWLLPVVMMAAPLVPQSLAPMATWSLPALVVTPHVLMATHPTAAFDWKHWVLVLWLLGAITAWVRLTAHYLRLRRIGRRAPSEWGEWLAEAAPGLDPERVRVHAAGPAVLWALPRALILLPADFAERFGDAATRELVLRHELTHVDRGDAWWSLAMEVMTASLWFHPLAWFARSRFRLDQELACDATSLRALPHHSARYARALLDSIAVQPAPALIPWLTEPQLRERIAMITRIPPGALRRRAGFLVVAVLLGSGLWLAGGHTAVQAATPASPALTPPSVDIAFKTRNPPHYPVAALRKGEQGVVMLDVKVDAAGNIQGISIDPSRTTAPAVLQQSAIKAAAGWRFKPGMRNGKPVGGVVRIPVTFSLVGMPPASKPDLVLKVHVDAAGHITDAVVDHAYPTSASPKMQARAIAEVKSVKVFPGKAGRTMKSGWYKVPFSFGPGSSAAPGAARVTATPIH